MPTSAASYVPDPPPIDLQLARVLGLYTPARMLSAHRAKRHRNTAVGGAQHGQRMNGIVLCFFFANPSFLLETAPPSRAGHPFLESRLRVSCMGRGWARRLLRRIVLRYRFLFCCRLAGRSFAYMWGVGLRADLKFNLANLARHKKK